MLTPQQKYDRSEKGLERHRRHYRKNKKKYFAEFMGRYYNPNPKKCSIKGCNVPGERHHPNYNKPAKIVWLCRKHHLAIHGKIRKKCSICGKSSHARKLCGTHYNAWLREMKKQ